MVVDAGRTSGQSRANNAQIPRKTSHHKGPASEAGQQELQPDEICKTSIPGSNPGGASKLLGSIPVTWVTDYSGDMGNTDGPNGLSIGSSRQVSSSKYPRS